ncbi:A disintegrin and metalloproteinase with thrombospondin motifs 3 [Liparis tanakae]|uniref:A disintegrin and metalloproteinase with thrombospondin motifs 3 n=1 Tax=Liparis tanakae TaxID=230148 RepID=A0A4Z2HG02_9TELE|nr:A disintegrin and metalloproteinase with thrombospondin motifs 3 [Liparis tanakae]
MVNGVVAERDSLQHVLGEYGLVRPISVDAEGRFLSHAVSASHMAGGQSRRRRRREVGVGNDEWEGPKGEPLAIRQRLYYNVTIFGREFHLRLHRNARLVAPGAKMEWHDDSDSTQHSEPLHDECLYVGDIKDTPGASVAISNCDGLRCPAVPTSSVTQPPGWSILCPALPFTAKNLLLAVIQGV